MTKKDAKAAGILTKAVIQQACSGDTGAPDLRYIPQHLFPRVLSDQVVFQHSNIFYRVEFSEQEKRNY